MAQALEELLNPCNPSGRTFRETLAILLPTPRHLPLSRRQVALHLAEGPTPSPRFALRALLQRVPRRAEALDRLPAVQDFPCQAEWILALTPMPTLSQALVEMVARFWGKGIQEAVAAPFFHSFLMDGRALGEWPALFRPRPPFGRVSQGQGGKEEQPVLGPPPLVLLERRGDQELLIHLAVAPWNGSCLAPALGRWSRRRGPGTAR